MILPRNVEPPSARRASGVGPGPAGPARPAPEAGPAVGGTPRPVHRPTGASLVVVITGAVTFGAIMAVHALRSDVDPLQDVMSHYANGSKGPLMSLVFYAFGVSVLALGVRLRTALDRHASTRAVPVLLALAGVGLLAAGVFEVDRPLAPQTVQEVIHSNAAVVAFVLLIVAMLLFSAACRLDARWRPLRWTSLGLATTAAVAAVCTQLAPGSGYSGAVQRVLAGAVLAWILMTAVHVRRRSFAAS